MFACAQKSVTVKMKVEIAMVVWVNDNPLVGGIIRLEDILEPRKALEAYKTGEIVVARCRGFRGDHKCMLARIGDISRRPEFQNLLGPAFAKIVEEYADILKEFSVEAVNQDISEMATAVGIERSSDDNWRETRTSTQCLSYLCLSEHLSDISFTFSADKNVKLPAHKFVLSMRSAVFEAMFYGSLSERGETVLIEDVEPDVMKVVLQYIYSDKPNIDGKNVLPCLYTAKKYDLSGLVQQCSDYLEKNIDESNVCTVYEQAIFYEMKHLHEICLSFIIENATKVLSSLDFLKLSHATLLDIFEKDDLACQETGVFLAAIKWAEHHCEAKNRSKNGQNVRDQLGEALFQIRFPIMPIEEFARVVTPSGILTNEELVTLYQYNATRGWTPLGKFRNQERSGAPVTVDLRRHSSCQFFTGKSSGCFLQLGYDSPPTGFPFPSPQLQPKKSIKIKSVSGTFVDNLTEIDNVNRSKITNFEVKGKKIIFKNPIDIPDHILIEFLFNNNNGFNFGNHVHTCSIKLKQFIKGEIISITRIPRGLESITFI